MIRRRLSAELFELPNLSNRRTYWSSYWTPANLLNLRNFSQLTKNLSNFFTKLQQELAGLSELEETYETTTYWTTSKLIELTKAARKSWNFKTHTEPTGQGSSYSANVRMCESIHGELRKQPQKVLSAHMRTIDHTGRTLFACFLQAESFSFFCFSSLLAAQAGWSRWILLCGIFVRFSRSIPFSLTTLFVGHSSH